MDLDEAICLTTKIRIYEFANKESTFLGQRSEQLLATKKTVKGTEVRATPGAPHIQIKTNNIVQSRNG